MLSIPEPGSLLVAHPLQTGLFEGAGQLFANGISRCTSPLCVTPNHVNSLHSPFVLMLQ